MFQNASPAHQLLYIGYYNPFVVVLSILVAIAYSYTAIAFSQSIQMTNSRYGKPLWLILSALTMGAGIWSTHFIGMLAYKLPCSVNYDTRYLMLSIIPAALSSAIAIDFINKKDASNFNIFTSSFTLGIGVAFTHYLGTRAMNIPGQIIYNSHLFMISVGSGILLGYIGLGLASKINDHRRKFTLLAATILGVSISCMHYIAMAASFFLKEGTEYSGNSIPNNDRVLINFLILVGVACLSSLFLVNIYFKIRSWLSKLEDQRQFSQLYDNIDDFAVLRLDLNGLIKTWNKTTERMLGYSAEELVGQKFSTLFSSNNRVNEIDLVKPLLLAVKDFKYENDELLTNNLGTEFWAHVQIRPMVSSNGKKNGFTLSILNINQRRMVENAIQNKEALIRRIADSISEGLYAVDADGKVIFMNAEAEKILGWRFNEISGRNIRQLIHYERHDGSSISLHDSIEYKSLTSGRCIESSEELFIDKSGERINIAMSVSPLFTGSEVSGNVVIFRNIHNQKSIENNLIQRASRMRELLEISPISVRIQSKITNRIVFANQSYISMLSSNEDDILNSSPQSFYEDPEEFTQIYELLRQNEQIKNRLVKLKSSRNETVWTLASYFNIEFEGENAVLGWFYDVTDLKKSKETAENANRLKSEFLSMMSHEVRTPMNAIVGMIDLLIESELDDQQKEFATILKDSSNNLLEIINDILDFSKIEAGQLEILNQDFNLKETIKGCVDLLSMNAKKYDLALSTNVSQSIPDIIKGDASRIRQVILNLLSNAIKFTERGSIELTAYADNFDADRFRLRIEIQDTGIGISEDSLKKLFQPFTQIDGSVTRKYGGTGLGLTICKRLVEAMGGSIGVQSQIGQGSTFWFELDLEYENLIKDEILNNQLTETSAILLASESLMKRTIINNMDLWKIKLDVVETELSLVSKIESHSRYDLCIIALDESNILIEDLFKAIRKKQPNVQILVICDKDKKTWDESTYVKHAESLDIDPSFLFDEVLFCIDRKKQIVEAGNARVDSQKIVFQQDDFSIMSRILLVDDNIINQKVALNQLNKLGYSVSLANNGEEALGILKSEKIDLVLMDCQMPVMDGYEATRKIRVEEKIKGGYLPIIAMTANAMAGHRVECSLAGMDGYLSKPVKLEELNAILKVWLDKETTLTTDPVKQTALPTINQSRLEELFGDDTKSIETILELFVSTVHELLGKLNKAINEENFPEIQAIGHQIKGSAANIGLEKMSHIGLSIELSGKDSNVIQSSELYLASIKGLRDVEEFKLSLEGK